MNGIYKSGVKVEPKENLPSKVTLVKIFASEFKKEISQRIDEIQSIHQSIPLDSEMAFELKVFVNDSFKCINKVLSLKSGISTQCKSHIDELQRSLTNFKSSPRYAINANFKREEGEESPWVILTNDCQHFIHQFWMTCDMFWASKKLPFRPTDRAIKHEFLKAVIQYSAEFKTEKFPPYFWILKYLKTTEKSISERTYRIWKTQMDEETFHHYTQPKKRFRQ
jgi:hypothetical protein